MTNKTNNLPNHNREKITLHSNGRVESKIPYINGKKHGKETLSREDGSKEMETMWAGGEKHGIEVWSHKDGVKKRVIPWVRGKKHGIASEWISRDARELEAIWGNDKRKETDTFRDDNNKSSTQKYYVFNEEYARIEWSDHGSVTKTNIPTPTQETANPGKSQANPRSTK